MTKRKVLCLLLALVMAASLLPASALAAGPVSESNEAVGYFYKQLNPQAKKIYEALNSADFKSGTEDIKLSTVVGNEAIDNYIKKGDQTLLNDFAAAKDAFDLDHSEVWYLDSSYLSLRPTKESDGSYEVWIGTGRADNYHLGGKVIEDVDTKQQALETVIEEIVAGAETAAQSADSGNDKTVAMVNYVHDEITERISYRYETDVKAGSGNEYYVRTIYALVTHEGVCESYARSMQVILTKLGIPCVLVHGVQTSGNAPEDHMWNAVKIGGNWYVVDATWDDPLVADWDGTRADHKDGLDGKETDKYLLVGQNKVGANWRPSGIVSSGAFEFTYPEMSQTGYTGETITTDIDSDLEVKYSTGGNMEGIPAGVFTITYQGMNLARAKAEGYYFMMKMHQSYLDGTDRGFDQWYYVDAALAAMGGGTGSQYFGDTENGLRVSTGHCDYVEVAVTTRAPIKVETWTNPPTGGNNDLTNHPEHGYFNGTANEIVAESGMLFNKNSQYYAPPYVYTQYPGCNYQVSTGTEYTMTVTWDDILYHPQSPEDRGPIAAGTDAPAVQDVEDNRPAALAQKIRVKYNTVQPDKDYKGDMPSVLTKDPPYDANRDGYVDDGLVTFHYRKDVCPKAKADANHKCSVQDGCPIDGLSFQFEPSDMWADDVTRYSFHLEGVVGSRSWKVPNSWEVTCVVPGSCPSGLRSQGIDWNLWGRPMLLDNFSDLDMEQIMMEDFNGRQQSLAELQEDMNVDSMNGRLLLSVEDISEGAGSRQKYDETTNALEQEEGIDPASLIANALYEINFTRLCSQIMAEPGQTIRIQIGYPAGVTYENFGKDVVLKVYHFTRCAEAHEAEGKHCEVLQSELAAGGDRKNHAWGSHIVSVEEIPIVPTPYGIVIMVDSFSPFEIVAMDADGARDADPNVLTGILTVANDENGSVSLQDGETGTEYKNMVKLEAGETYTFAVKPHDGYAFEAAAVSDDQTLTVTDNHNNTVTVAVSGDYDGAANEIINFTFIPETVQQADKNADRISVAPKVCAHSHVTVTHEAKAATCETAGQTEGRKCRDCGQVLQEFQTIPAIGHEFKVPLEDPKKEPTCTEEGYEYMKCVHCSETKKMVLPVIPHNFENGQCTVCGAKDPDYTTDATVDTGSAANGSFTVSDPHAKAGEIVTVTLKPDKGYVVGRVTVTDRNGVQVPVTVNSDGTYSFEMVDRAVQPVTVEVTFVCDGGDQCPSRNYTDVDHSKWYHTAVDYAIANGLMNGTAENIFEPGTTTTRAMVVTILYRLEGKPAAGASAFADVPAEGWYSAAVGWAAANDIVNGYSPEQFGPEDPVTREQMAVILHRYAEYKGYDVSNLADLSGYADAGSISGWDGAETAMRWAVGAGLIEGKSDSILDPAGNSNRDQTATLLMRFRETFGK